MPTTRAARAAARAAAGVLFELPADVLGLVIYQLTLAHDIAAVAPTCHALCDAVKLAMKARPFSGEVVTLAGRGGDVNCVAIAPDGRIITGSEGPVRIWRDGVCERTIQAHTDLVFEVEVLSGGARFLSVSDDHTAKLWVLDGTLERTFAAGSRVLCAAAVPDGAHFVVGLDNGDENEGEVRLYHVDGTLVHSFKEHIEPVDAVAVTRDGQHTSVVDRTVKVNVAKSQ